MARGMLGNFQFIFAQFNFVLFLNRHLRSDFVVGLGKIDLSLIVNHSSPIPSGIEQGPTRFLEQSYHLQIEFIFSHSQTQEGLSVTTIPMLVALTPDILPHQLSK